METQEFEKMIAQGGKCLITWHSQRSLQIKTKWNGLSGFKLNKIAPDVGFIITRLDCWYSNSENHSQINSSDETLVSITCFYISRQEQDR